MADEGDIVYFETSPAAENAHSDNIFTATTSNISRDKRKPSPSIYTTALTEIRSRLQGYLNSKQLLEENIINAFIHDAVTNTPLLTDEDVQLLEFVFTDKLTNITKGDRNFKWINIIISLFVIGISSLVHSYLLSFVLVSGGLLIVMFIKVRQYQIQQNRSQLDIYLNQTHSLLCLLMKGLYSIQERQIVHHGFTRPVQGVPVDKLDMSSSTSQYQCLTLRQRIMTICDNCINEVKRITLILIEEYHLNLELDNKYSYLIYRDLGGQEEQPLNMSLECLKKKANLFVVLNSEMLRRLLLVLGTHLIINEHDTVNRFSLCSAAKIISPFNDVINISIKQLQWSLDYEYHYQVGKLFILLYKFQLMLRALQECEKCE
jgi:hypothetical protein